MYLPQSLDNVLITFVIGLWVYTCGSCVTMTVLSSIISDGIFAVIIPIVPLSLKSNSLVKNYQ